MPILNFQTAGGNDDDTYGVNFEDVRRYLPHRRWSPDSVRPNQADVEFYITEVSSILGVAIRPLPGVEDQANRLLALAHRAVALGAAAHAEAAGMPERAKPNETSSYATWLWECWEEAMSQARAFADAIAPGEDPAGTDPQALEPAWSFPPPARIPPPGS